MCGFLFYCFFLVDGWFSVFAEDVAQYLAGFSEGGVLVDAGEEIGHEVLGAFCCYTQFS
jgi:hypothetical protein